MNPYLDRDPPRQRTTPLDRDPRQRPLDRDPPSGQRTPPPHAGGNDYFSKNQENGMEPMQRVIQLVPCNTVIVALNFYKDTWCQLKTTKGGSKEPVKKFRWILHFTGLKLSAMFEPCRAQKDWLSTLRQNLISIYILFGLFSHDLSMLQKVLGAFCSKTLYCSQ